MDKRRLRILAKFLRGIDRKHFDLESWCEIDGGKVKDGVIQTVGCATTACAMGWATSIPSFRRDGLRLVKQPEQCLAGSHGPMFKGVNDLDAAVLFFGISWSAAYDLFVPNSYPENQRRSPIAVAKRIEKLIA